MFSTKIKTVILMAGTLVVAFSVFTFTDTGTNLAAAITGVNNQVTKCIEKLPEGKRESDYNFTKKRLNTDSKKDIILTATSEAQCGSAGCTHELCLVKNNTAEIISFGYAAETLVIKDTASNGMYDIQLQGKSTTNLQWDGTRYIILQ